MPAVLDPRPAPASASGHADLADRTDLAEGPVPGGPDETPAPRPPVARPPVAWLPTALPTALAGAACVALWAGAVWAAGHVSVSPALHTAALFGHLVCLVIGFGAVLVVDYHGLLWLTGRRTLPEVLRVAATLHPPVWAGTAGLVATGVFLGPDLDAPLTRVKLLAVLVIALNGLAATALSRRLAPSGRLAPSDGTTGLRPAALLLGGATAAVSQAAWWTALVIGFLNARH
ncbi:hypothetical protein [Streptomyces sp. NPDC056144]|uniref:hypothetical protein n=1 Tax=unclassified Streptomyces TaxID=2593676 RepID=UPI0035D6C768